MSHSLDFLELSHRIDLYFIVQLAMVIICAGIIGWERQISKKPAGIRTSVLIAMGSMIFVKYSLLAGEAASNADPARVMGQVVTGIGFLGAGTIMNREGLVAGLTTAATIWVQAAIGAVIALGWFVDALVFSIITVIVLNLFIKLEIWLRLSKIHNKGRKRAGVATGNISDDRAERMHLESINQE